MLVFYAIKMLGLDREYFNQKSLFPDTQSLSFCSSLRSNSLNSPVTKTLNSAVQVLVASTTEIIAAPFHLSNI
jgi:hypothetical protein